MVVMFSKVIFNLGCKLKNRLLKLQSIGDFVENLEEPQGGRVPGVLEASMAGGGWTCQERMGLHSERLQGLWKVSS